ncbi:Peptidyl-prolyl cis-trans isomerase [Quillaja saponaria]|uniref:Peptidyl-prolyl cis-trans isomerase n=1 Tax=Quillaja saponaria TaxID=32244 RepID=A0AAD7KYL1_QUISA|nr:Peptidyl-prolyl cis-trans isomerase [Quillaja saponaria]
MNQRTRSIQKSSPSRTESLHKYLKPGALARLRDSRISARSHRVRLISQICLHRISPPSSPQSNESHPLVNVNDGFPCFAGRVYGPRFPQRKKLMAVKCVLSQNPNPSSSVPDSSDPIIDSFSNDILVAN